uniref:receptor-type tyrosine-protein phosphatase F-like n=1 Tax=Styela clava TaxID=7725 RepID=UPI00193A3910|nr:receptor-type tyrosine-protein phosphatase F-like [Styela clava]
MVLSTNQTTYVGIKNQNITMYVQVKSQTDDVSIAVILVSSPRGVTESLDQLESKEGITTYGLTIENLTTADAGEWTIRSQSSSDDEELYPNINQNLTLNLRMEVIPENLVLTPTSPFTYILKSSNNTVVCDAFGVPEPDFEWTDTEGSSLTHGITSVNETLFLKNSYFSDNGTYRCKATNDASERSGDTPTKDIEIRIEGSPIITGENQNFDPIDNITLTCYMDANPIPSDIYWTTNSSKDYAAGVFSTASETVNDNSGKYYKYETSLALTSQLCMGQQQVACQANNTIGGSDGTQIFTINIGNYDLHGEYYYIFFDDPLAYDKSEKKCQSLDGHLVYVTTEDIQEYLNTKADYDYYIGLMEDGGEWRWGSDGPYLNETYSNFTDGDDPSEGDCVISTTDGWNTTACNKDYKYICQLKASGIPKEVAVSRNDCDGKYLDVNWQPYDDDFATTLHRIEITNVNGTSIDPIIFNCISPCDYNYKNSSLTPDTQYLIEIYAGVDRCKMFLPSASVLQTTGKGTPKQVSDASMAQNSQENVCTITWSYNETLAWQIDNYTVTINTQLNVDTGENVEITPMVKTTEATNFVFEMEPNSKYTSNIFAVSCAGKGEAFEADLDCTTPVSAPETVPKATSPQKPDSEFDPASGIEVTVAAVDQRYGPVSCVFVVVTVDGSKQNSEDKKIDSSTAFEEANEGKNGQYFAYVTSNASETFTITLGKGRGTTSCNPINNVARKRRATYKDVAEVEATNKNLDYKKYYRYYVLTTTPSSESEFLTQISELSPSYVTKPYLLWIIGVVIPILVIIAAVLGFLYYRRRKQNEKKNSEFGVPLSELSPRDEDYPVYENVEAQIDVQPHPIKASDLENDYHYKHADDNRLFREEYKTIKEQAKKLEMRFAHAKRKEKKNQSISENAVVHLKQTGNGPTSEYINASYIDGYKKLKKFIATQGPKPNTINDFWRMIWEHRIEAIVMVTNVDENGRRKCEKYWPEEMEKGSYGEFDIACTGDTSVGQITRRKFKIISSSHPNRTQVVVQYHYTTWPDHGVPQTTSALFNLRRIVRTEFGESNYPIVVHCSAGVGRTGTFIALDNLMEELESTGTVDVYSQVWRMRQRRTEMVQTADQYVLVHKMLLENYLLKDTDMDVSQAEEKLTIIRSPQNNVLENEFRLISRVPPLDTDKDVGHGHSKVNRENNVIPYDHNIAPIRMRPDENSTPYFNATKLQGYEQDEWYILAQDPLPGREEIFWRMVLDNDVKCIVMIRHGDRSQKPCAKYWPEIVEHHGSIMLSPQETFEEKNLLTRTIFVRETILQTTRSSSITQFDFTGWPQGPSQDVNTILDLITRLQRQKQHMDGSSGPVLVHCSDGSQRTGTFCAIISLLQRLKTESRVDVLRSVKDLRDMRAYLVGDLTEYRLCYDAVEAYLRSFDLYSNFR